MQRWLLALCALLPSGTVSLARDADPVALKIRHFGLEGAYTVNAGPTWLEVSARNTTPQTLTFRISVAQVNLDDGARPVSERFSIPVTLNALEERSANVPLAIVPLPKENPIIYVEAVAADGHILGRTGYRAEEKTEGQVVVLLCTTPELCRTMRQSILLSGSPEEQSHKSQTLHLIQLSELPRDRWAYAPAGTVVVATPASKLSSAQRDALEAYLLGGGTLVLVEDQLADSSNDGRFLAPYRAHIPLAKISTVNLGKLIRLSSVSSKDFSDYFRPLGFTSYTPEEAIQATVRFRLRELQPGAQGQVHWLMQRLGTSFRFPSFLALLLWIIAYLVLVGIVNFVVLRRIGRPELGWITIPSLAVLFSILLYIVSVRTHPSNFGLDEMVVHHLNNLSSMAISEAKLRVSAPIRAEIRPTLPGNVIYVQRQQNLMVDLGVSMRGAAGVQQIQLGDNWEAHLGLRRWSFQDLDFESQRRFPGTIYRDPNGRLHNDTGLAFQQAILVTDADVFLLGDLPAAAAVDLARVPHHPFDEESGHRPITAVGYPDPPFFYHKPQPEPGVSAEDQKRFEQEFLDLPNQPFSVLEMIRGWPQNGEEVFRDTKAVFFGLSIEGSLGAALRGLSPDRKTYSLTIVNFEEWP